MTEPIFYCYDDICGFETHSSLSKAETYSDSCLCNTDDFTEDTEIHFGLLIPFAKLVEKDGELSLVDTTADDVRESIQELDKRGLNTTANELLEKLRLADESARKYAGEVVRLKTALMDAEDALGSCDNPTDSEIDEVVAIIKKALGES